MNNDLIILMVILYNILQRYITFTILHRMTIK